MRPGLSQHADRNECGCQDNRRQATQSAQEGTDTSESHRAAAFQPQSQERQDDRTAIPLNVGGAGKHLIGHRCQGKAADGQKQQQWMDAPLNRDLGKQHHQNRRYRHRQIRGHKRGVDEGSIARKLGQDIGGKLIIRVRGEAQDLHPIRMLNGMEIDLRLFRPESRLDERGRVSPYRQGEKTRQRGELIKKQTRRHPALPRLKNANPPYSGRLFFDSEDGGHSPIQSCRLPPSPADCPQCWISTNTCDGRTTPKLPTRSLP